MNQKRRDAVKILKWLPLISGIGMLLMGVLYYVWLNQILIAGAMIFDGFFKLGIGLGLYSYLNIDSKENDE